MKARTLPSRLVRLQRSGDAVGELSGLAGCRILIVDDEPLLVLELRGLVEDLGCKVAGVAHDIASAMLVARDALYDVAILDIKLQNALIDPVVEVVAARRIPMVFATGYTADARDASAIILSKPIVPAKLREALEQALQIASC